jgi:hypothetical protein
MTRRYSSNAIATTLAAGCTDSATSIQVTATTGFPAVDFILALDYGESAQELVLVTGVAGTTLTVTRGYDSTTAQAHTLGAVVRHVHSAIDFRESRTHEEASTGVHGISGSVVGTTDTQSLTNKNLSSGTNMFPASILTTTSTSTVTNKDLSSGTNIFPSTLATDAEVTSAVSTHAAVTATHGATGAVVGTTNTQTLTNKTLDSPVVTGVGAVSYVAKTADESVTSSTTLQNDDHLFFTVDAAGTYVFDVWLYGTSAANAAGDLKVGFTFPTGTCHMGGAGASINLAADSIDSGEWLAFAPATSGSTVTQFGLSTAVTQSHVHGTLIATATGTLRLQWAQFSSSASASTLKAGSHMLVRRVA